MVKGQKYHILYKTINILNGNFYIGIHSTHNLNDGYLGSGLRLWNSIHKHGIENFKREVLEYFDTREELVAREKEIVNEELLIDSRCMNLKPGGNGGFCNEDHQLKCSSGGGRGLKTKLDNDIEFKNHFTDVISKSNLVQPRGFILNKCDWNGRKHRSEFSKKISEINSLAQKGERNSQFGTVWITNGIENKKVKRGATIDENWKLGRTIK